jgi:hypothetical protein
MNPDEIRNCAIYLQKNGFSIELLRDLHHSPYRTETLDRTIKYFSEVSSVREANIRYGERLRYVTSHHRQTGKSFEQLTTEAIEKY